jgi:hypothetical protein
MNIADVTGVMPITDSNTLLIANATGTNGLTCLPKHGGAQDNKFWSLILRLVIETGA